MKLEFSMNLQRLVKLLLIHHEKSVDLCSSNGNLGSPIKEACVCGGEEDKLNFWLKTFDMIVVPSGFLFLGYAVEYFYSTEDLIMIRGGLNHSQT